MAKFVKVPEVGKGVVGQIGSEGIKSTSAIELLRKSCISDGMGWVFKIYDGIRWLYVSVPDWFGKIPLVGGALKTACQAFLIVITLILIVILGAVGTILNAVNYIFKIDMLTMGLFLLMGVMVLLKNTIGWGLVATAIFIICFLQGSGELRIPGVNVLIGIGFGIIGVAFGAVKLGFMYFFIRGGFRLAAMIFPPADYIDKWVIGKGLMIVSIFVIAAALMPDKFSSGALGFLNTFLKYIISATNAACPISHG